MRRWVAFAVLVLLTAAPSAQQALDRKKIPPPGKTPELRVPAWTKSALPDGADLIVSEKHDLPLVLDSMAGGEDVALVAPDDARDHSRATPAH